jgi:hypothetical protein
MKTTNVACTETQPVDTNGDQEPKRKMKIRNVSETTANAHHSS